MHCDDECQWQLCFIISILYNPYTIHFGGIFGNNHVETHMFIGACIIGKCELGVFCYRIILVCTAVEQMLLSDT